MWLKVKCPKCEKEIAINLGVETDRDSIWANYDQVRQCPDCTMKFGVDIAVSADVQVYENMGQFQEEFCIDDEVINDPVIGDD